MSQNSKPRSKGASAKVTALCQKVDLEEDEIGPARWRKLLFEFRQANLRQADQGQELTSPQLAVPFTDIVVRDRHAMDFQLAKSLQSELEIEFAGAGVEMSATSVHDPAFKNRTAYFGYGVFAPMGHDTQTADLQFSWSGPDPNTGKVGAAKILQPKLFFGTDARPAGWYAGQKGIAISFDSIHCPVRLPLSDHDMDEAVSKALKGCILFIGRRNRYSQPKLELHQVNDIAGDAHVSMPGSIYDAIFGKWSLMHLKVGNQTADLWFRILSRSGAARFTIGSSPAAKLRIKGILLPQIRQLFLPGFSRPTRWLVHFDQQGKIRGNEIVEPAVSVVAETLGRLAAYFPAESPNHQWTGAHAPVMGVQSLEIGNGKLVKIRAFPEKEPLVPEPEDEGQAELATIRAADLRSNLRKMYGKNDWRLLTLNKHTDLAMLEITEGEICGEPVISTELSPEGDERLSLDWLNRVAQIEVGGKIMGAGEYWASKFKFLVRSISDKSITTEISVRDGRKQVTMELKVGERGLIGPLLVEFRGKDRDA